MHSLVLVCFKLLNFIRFNRGGYDRWQESDPSPCKWWGVSCDGNGHVESLNLTGLAISGPAFSNFSWLSALTSLDLSDNSITGPLPDGDLNQCHGLLRLNLSHNLITESLNVSVLTRLQILDVSGNRLQGGVAVNFPAICADLTFLDLYTNNLTDNSTNLLDGCARLEYVDLSSNNFNGELWPSVARFRKFSAAENNLTGSVPSSTFPDGCMLQSLDLSTNQLLGNFPDSIARCVKLTYMSLWGNNFTGMIPAGTGKLAALGTLILGNNGFDRQIPMELMNSKRLQFLDISTNMFGGDMQDIFGNFTTLKYLGLHHNNYTGGIVASGVLRLPLLARLDLSFNEFTGELPPEVSDMKSLKYLMLAENDFSGRIPPEYSRLTKLQALDLSNNMLSGGIPTSIGNLTSLLWLMLAGNQLSGKIPPEIGNCTSLLWLNLADNRLTGNIPPEMAEMGRNPGPTFARNRNDPSVLTCFSECQAMRRWVPESLPPFSFIYSVMKRENCRSIWDRILKGYGIVPICMNSWSLPGSVLLSRNMLSGEIPPRIGAMRNLSLLLLDDNRLTGRLPLEIGRLPLVVLHISRNNISGPIPSEIGEIMCLERLDLSSNNLSGELPMSLFKLTQLVMFNVSYNPFLSGNISINGQFDSFGEQSFLGDPLISFPQVFFGSSVLVNLLLISILLFGTYCGITITSRKKLQSSQSSGSSILAPKIFTYNELEKATSGFHEVLGSGASGTVYKGQLQDEHVTSIAVKKIKKLQQETEKEFMVEVQTMGQTSHKNLVRLLGLCNEGTDRLLVYEFMTNGSLNEFLFGDARPHWSLRVQVALGVARGLLYLHEECSTQIIHCDIKPQNILLDDNFMAKIADFGLAKPLQANQTQTNTGIRGTRGYVAPEWFKNIRITSKVDVYSFGVILLELVCCRRNVEVEIADEEQAILTYWANDCYRSGRIDLLVEGDDEAIFNIKKAEHFVAVALWCLQEEPTMRPTMHKVAEMLDGAVQIPTPPDPSSYISSLEW
ncbi:hypothetical protein CFC21_027507 [Triticum aestivum]|uniref:non-specific serine/threonine protein kinase n=2 Tax=Triticum aestivum TaxID=4565 RepID=A0A9R1EN06_WHEAT|nr:hypothetical protein CFC21_027507 [Triticum aestivum]